jgi:hypothetical protein
MAEGNGLSGGNHGGGSAVCARECTKKAIEGAILFDDVNDVANLADASVSILGLGILSLGILGWRILS